MLRQEIGRERDFIGIIAHGEIIWHDVRIMGAIEGEVTEERTAFVLFEEAGGFVGESLAGVFGREFWRGELAVLQVAELGFKITWGGQVWAKPLHLSPYD